MENNHKGAIDTIVRQTIALGDIIAAKDAEIKSLSERLSIFSTLKEINHYMCSTMEFSDILAMINDIVLGLLGASACAISSHTGKEIIIKEFSVLPKLEGVMNLEFFKEIESRLPSDGSCLVIQDLREHKLPNFCEEGSLLVCSAIRGGISYGTLVAYYPVKNVITSQREDFFDLLSSQLGTHIENAHLYNKMKELATVDGLTNLKNRTFLNSRCNSDDYGSCSQVSAVMLDLDDFKHVNDTYGHPIGDAVLAGTAAIIAEEAEKFDAEAYRYGGEECLVILRNANLAETHYFAEAVLNRIRSKTYSSGKGLFTVTASFGIATSMCSDCILTIISNSDIAMYEAKRSGKNKIMVYSQDLRKVQGWDGKDRRNPVGASAIA